MKGKIIRSGYVPHGGAAMNRYGNNYAMTRMAMANAAGAGQPINLDSILDAVLEALAARRGQAGYL